MTDLIVDLVLGVHIPRYKEGTDKDNSHAIVSRSGFGECLRAEGRDT
jgi:hypothetical protein